MKLLYIADERWLIREFHPWSSSTHFVYKTSKKIITKHMHKQTFFILTKQKNIDRYFSEVKKIYFVKIHEIERK